MTGKRSPVTILVALVMAIPARAGRKLQQERMQALVATGPDGRRSGWTVGRTLALCGMLVATLTVGSIADDPYGGAPLDGYTLEFVTVTDELFVNDIRAEVCLIEEPALVPLSDPVCDQSITFCGDAGAIDLRGYREMRVYVGPDVADPLLECTGLGTRGTIVVDTDLETNTCKYWASTDQHVVYHMDSAVDAAGVGGCRWFLDFSKVEDAAPSLQYDPDLEALRDQWDSTGTLTVRVPILDYLVLTGRDTNLRGQGLRPGAADVLHVLGSAVGYPGSTANVLVGEYAVYGSVEIPDAEGDDWFAYSFNSVEIEPSVYETLVRLRTNPTNAPTGNATAVTTTFTSPAPTTAYTDTWLDSGPANITSFPTLDADLTTTSSTNIIRDDDGVRDTWYDFDYRDDVATKRLQVGTGDLQGATSAKLHVLARARYCDDLTHDPHYLLVNNDLSIPYNPCTKWGSLFEWRFFSLNPGDLKAGAENSFQIIDSSSRWNNQDLHLALDTSRDYGRTDAEVNGNSRAGELMWYLEIEVTANGGACVDPGSSSQVKAASGVTGSHASSPPDPCDPEPPCQSHAWSWITYHASKGFVSKHSNWKDRIYSAGAKTNEMFSQLCISTAVWPVGLGVDILGSANNPDAQQALTDYEHWIANEWTTGSHGKYYNDAAYQLWTAKDLTDGGYCAMAYGIGAANTVDMTRSGHSIAVSVVEAVDTACADNNDPDEVHERGIVSTHELGHSYGEENHPYECSKDKWYRTPYACNVMRNCKDPGNRAFYWDTASKEEIMFWFHYKIEAVSHSDDEDDCPYKSA